MFGPRRYRRWCRACGRHVLAVATDSSALGHAGLTCLTLGLWLPVAAVVVVYEAVTRPARCPDCGHKC